MPQTSDQSPVHCALCPTFWGENGAFQRQCGFLKITPLCPRLGAWLAMRPPGRAPSVAPLSKVLILSTFERGAPSGARPERGGSSNRGLPLVILEGMPPFLKRGSLLTRRKPLFPGNFKEISRIFLEITCYPRDFQEISGKFLEFPGISWNFQEIPGISWEFPRKFPRKFPGKFIKFLRGCVAPA